LASHVLGSARVERVGSGHDHKRTNDEVTRISHHCNTFTTIVLEQQAHAISTPLGPTLSDEARGRQTPPGCRWPRRPGHANASLRIFDFLELYDSKAISTDSVQNGTTAETPKFGHFYFLSPKQTCNRKSGFKTFVSWMPNSCPHSRHAASV
jgi:hypothetical protein